MPRPKPTGEALIARVAQLKARHAELAEFPKRANWKGERSNVAQRIRELTGESVVLRDLAICTTYRCDELRRPGYSKCDTHIGERWSANAKKRLLSPEQRAAKCKRDRERGLSPEAKLKRSLASKAKYAAALVEGRTIACEICGICGAPVPPRFFNCNGCTQTAKNAKGRSNWREAFKPKPKQRVIGPEFRAVQKPTVAPVRKASRQPMDRLIAIAAAPAKPTKVQEAPLPMATPEQLQQAREKREAMRFERAWTMDDIDQRVRELRES